MRRLSYRAALGVLQGLNYETALEVLEYHQAATYWTQHVKGNFAEEVGYYDPKPLLMAYRFDGDVPDWDLPDGTSFWENETLSRWWNDDIVREVDEFWEEWLPEDEKRLEVEEEKVVWWVDSGYGECSLLVSFANPHDRKLEIIRTAWAVLRMEKRVENWTKYLESEDCREHWVTTPPV